MQGCVTEPTGGPKRDKLDGEKGAVVEALNLSEEEPCGAPPRNEARSITSFAKQSSSREVIDFSCVSSHETDALDTNTRVPKLRAP